jgi:hypothetical protein
MKVIKTYIMKRLTRHGAVLSKKTLKTKTKKKEKKEKKDAIKK